MNSTDQIKHKIQDTEFKKKYKVFFFLMHGLYNILMNNENEYIIQILAISYWLIT